MKKLSRYVAATAVGAGAVLALAQPASAHVYPSISESPAGGFALFDIVVPHGCEEAATTKLEVQIPDGIYNVTPEVVAGWTATVQTEELPEPVDDGHGGEYTERDAVVTWEGGPLAHDQLTRFGLSLQMPDTPGETILFPAIQTCEGGATTEWIEPPNADGSEPELPAPAITLTEAEGGHGGGEEEEATDEATDDGEAVSTDDTEAAASTSDDDDSDSNGLAIAGLVAGLIGIGLGGAAFVRSGKGSASSSSAADSTA